MSFNINKIKYTRQKECSFLYACVNVQGKTSKKLSRDTAKETPFLYVFVLLFETKQLNLKEISTI